MSSPPEPFLRLCGVSKRFGAVTALDGVDISVDQDELLVILGPTGAGKTTLLRTIAGLERADGGTIEMGEAGDVSALSPAERDVALVFQNFSLYPHWSVRRNMEFPLRAPGRNLSDAIIRERVDWAASLLKIPHLLDRKATRLSGGEMQRVAIGRAIVRQPRLFLMDEPLTNLDAKLREALRVELVALRRALATPMIFVTHNQAEAMSMGDRVVVLGQGRVLQTGTPEEVYRSPRSPTVATQLGQPRINLIAVEKQGEQRLASRGGISFAINGHAAHGGRRMTIGIRPEDIQLDGGEQAGLVELVENTGPGKVALVAWAGERIHVLLPKDTGFQPGDTVYPRFDPARLVFWEEAD